MGLKQIIYLAVFLYSLVAAIDRPHFKVDNPPGVWTQVLSPFMEHDKAAFPAQYFMCGFQLQIKWYVRWGWWHIQVSHNKKPWSSNGFKAIFCSYNNWNDQRTVNFTTNDPINLGWTQTIMCPYGTYAQRFRPGFGIYKGLSTGLNGLQLDCQPLSQSSSTTVSKGLTNQFQAIVSGKKGYFISAIQLKYINFGMLTGVQFVMQAPAQIAKIDFIYNLNNTLMTDTISSFEIRNGGSEAIIKQFNESKEFTTQRTYETTNIYQQGYKIKRNAQIKFPLASVSMSLQNYKQTAGSNFAFGQRYINKWSPSRSLSFVIPAKTKVTSSFVRQYQIVDVPFTAQVTFANLNTGQFIGKSQIQGKVRGTHVRKISIETVQQAYKGISGRLLRYQEND